MVELDDNKAVVWAQALEPTILEMTSPIIAFGGRQPEIGTAHLFRLGGHDFLVTAAHVLDEGRASAKLVRPASDFMMVDAVPISGHVMGIGGRDHTLDLVAVRLDPGHGLPIAPITAEHIAPDWKLRPGEFAMACGYPAALLVRDEQGAPRRVRHMTLVSAGVADTALPEDVRTGGHVALEYPASMAWRVAHDGVTRNPDLPEPQGISGCAIWAHRAHEGRITSFRDLRVVGFVYTFYDERRLLVGNDVNTLLAWLLEAFPDCAIDLKEEYVKAGWLAD